VNTDAVSYNIASDRPSPSGAPVSEFRVLVVCTGNLYRSPLAECLLRHRLGETGQEIRLSSAGTRAVPGTPMAAAAEHFLLTRGADPTGTGSHRLTRKLVERSDLVLGAATEHREAVVRLSPVRALSRAFTLCEFVRLMRAQDALGVVDPAARFAALVQGAAARRGAAGAHLADDVEDPLGAPPRQVQECLARIDDAVERIAAAVRIG